MADWASLNHDLIIVVAERLPSLESYQSFAGVCKSWKEAAREGHINQIIFEGPWLMYAEKLDEGEVREFSSISSDLTTTTRKIFLPEASKQRCVSCKDWLFVTSPNQCDTSLLHPLSRVQIQLPKLSTLLFYDSEDEFSVFVEKAVISSNPATNSDYIVIIICGRAAGLAFWKSGDTSWTAMEFPDVSFEDIIYSDNNKMLYCLDAAGSIYSFDIHEPNTSQLIKVSGGIPRAKGKELPDKWYLVELSGGKFLVASKYLILDDDSELYHTECFLVFEVNAQDGTCEEVHDLGNKALFVGYNTSYFIECSEFNKCKPNCIYFCDDYKDGYLCTNSGGGKDMGIYCLSDGSIRCLFNDKIGCDIVTPPTWIGSSF